LGTGLSMKKRYVLLDRDGTLIEEREYLSDPKGVQLIPGVLEGLRQLQMLGFGLIIITNQSGVGRGYFTLKQMDEVNAELRNQLLSGGVTIDGIYCCPHAPEEDCLCRKPKTGLIKIATHEFDFDPTKSIVIGDKEADIKFGVAIGLVSILVLTGHGNSELNRMTDKPEHVVADLTEAVNLISEQNL